MERIQSTAKKKKMVVVPELLTLPYEERLECMNLPVLEQRKERGHWIMMYKLSGIDRKDLMEGEQRRGLRRHSKSQRKGMLDRQKEAQLSS